LLFVVVDERRDKINENVVGLATQLCCLLFTVLLIDWGEQLIGFDSMIRVLVLSSSVIGAKRCIYTTAMDVLNLFVSWGCWLAGWLDGFSWCCCSRSAATVLRPSICRLFLPLSFDRRETARRRERSFHVFARRVARVSASATFSRLAWSVCLSFPP